MDNREGVGWGRQAAVRQSRRKEGRLLGMHARMCASNGEGASYAMTHDIRQPQGTLSIYHPRRPAAMHHTNPDRHSKYVSGTAVRRAPDGQAARTHAPRKPWPASGRWQRASGGGRSEPSRLALSVCNTARGPPRTGQGGSGQGSGQGQARWGCGGWVQGWGRGARSVTRQPYQPNEWPAMLAKAPHIHTYVPVRARTASAKSAPAATPRRSSTTEMREGSS